jgi:hypothetical protein
MDATNAENERQRAEEAAKAQAEAQRQWKAATVADDHPYLAAKSVPAYGIRVDSSGRLVIPLRDPDGVIHSLQTISPDGQKLFLKGGAVSGHYHPIGKPEDTICICEGYATGVTIHGTGVAVAVAFNDGNLLPVAQVIREKYPNIGLVIAADNDQWTDGNPGVTKAREAAIAVKGKLVVPQFKNLDSKPTDFNDLARLEGAETLAEQLARTTVPNTDESPRMRAQGSDRATVLPDWRPSAATLQMSKVQPEPIKWLWPNRMALGKLTLIAGDPGLGKSLISIALASHVSRGSPWPVDKTECPCGDVVMLSAEDDPADTIRPRLDAAGADVSRVYVMTGVNDIDQDTGRPVHRMVSLKKDLAIVEDLLRTLPNCRLLVVDPISAYLDGADSHNNSDIRGLLAPLSDLASRYGVAAVGITHLNKGGHTNALYRATGSLAFVAAARAVFMVSKDKDDPARRLVLPAKNNLAPDTTGVAYSVIEAENGAPAVGWEPDPVTITAEEALTSESDDVRSEREEAEEWLLDVLAGSPIKTIELQKWAREAGHSWRTVKRAKTALKIEATKSGFSGGWSWSLPENPPKGATNPQEGQSHGVAPFGEVGPLCGNGTELEEGVV